jgi:hypothetical protein
MVRHAKEPAEFYGLKVPLDAEYSIGSSWAGEPVATESIEESLPLQPARDPAPCACPTDRTPESATPHTGSNGAARHDLENPRRENDGAHGNGAHPLVRDHPRTAVTDEVSERGGAFESLDERLARIPLPDLVGDSGLVHCPFHDDNTPSCHIYVDHFYCFGCGACGNHLDWLRNAEGMSDAAAIEVLFKWQGPAAPRHEAGAERKRELALQLWAEAKSIAGTPAVRYLAEVRGIDVAALPTDDAALRFHPNCPFGRGRYEPCLIALFRDIASNEPVGIHRVMLSPDVFAGEKVQRRMLGARTNRARSRSGRRPIGCSSARESRRCSPRQRG